MTSDGLTLSLFGIGAKRTSECVHVNMNLNHLHLHVRDIAASRAFYEKYFGFAHVRLTEDEGKFIIVQNTDEFDLALNQDAEPPAIPKWSHFGFRLANAAAVREKYQRFVSDGVAIRAKLQEYEDLVTFRVNDPDGYAVEVYWELIN